MTLDTKEHPSKVDEGTLSGATDDDPGHRPAQRP